MRDKLGRFIKGHPSIGGFKKGHPNIYGFQKGHKFFNGGEKGWFKKGIISISKAHPELMPRGEKHHFWKGGIIRRCGYFYVLYPSHPNRNKDGYVKRSNLVMEKVLGRYLTKDEIVHHKGEKYPIHSIENKQDDRSQNLELFSNKSSHAKFHHPKGSPFLNKS